ncbi:MAG: hypothetical protein ACLSW4_02555 [Clostridia bacterium]|jgi:hypothetical protein
MKKKNIIIIAIIVVLIILLFPIPNKLKDGGTVEYKALLYTITDYHKITPGKNEKEYLEGVKLEILGFEIFNSLEEKEEITSTNKEENIKESNEENLELASDIEYSSFVGTVLEETTEYMIVEPNEDETERKSADKIKINYGTNHIDYLYGIGRKVVIYYTGYIMESYPAQINTDKISTDGYEDFKIEVKLSDKIETKKILNNKDLSSDKQDYNLYFYGLDEVNVTIKGQTMSLEKALKSGKMTLDGIIQKANKDEKEGKIRAEMYKEGGSMEYHYKDYTIIKCHSTSENSDVYIGIPSMKLNDLNL